MNRKKIQTFNNGVLSICTVTSSEKLSPIIPNLRFNNRTVGAERFFKAKETQHTLSRIVRIPQVKEIEDSYVVIIDDKQYNIMQVQSINDTSPPCWQLSLEIIKKRLEFEADDGD